MLDKAEFIAKYDLSDALGVIGGQAAQLRHDYAPVEMDGEGITAIVVAGMGGSALAAEFIKNWLGDRLPVPLVIARGYELPGFVGAGTLVVASSYSGNTEETLAALADAEARGARVAVVASGGKLIERAQAAGHPHFEVPGGLQPRLAVLYGVKALVVLFESLGLLQGLTTELEQASTWLEGKQTAWQADKPTADNPAKQIAEAVHGHVAVVYGGPTLSLPAMKWKIDFNENAKNIAFYNYLPEFNHNEFMGWGHPRPSGLVVIELRSDLDHPQVQKRFDVTNELLAEAFQPIEVMADGEARLEQMLYTLLLGDYTSAYLAFLNGIDPTPVELIEALKKRLA